MSLAKSPYAPAQQTITKSVTIHGRGYLTGVDVDLTFHPADPDTGVVFVRSDLPGRPEIPAVIGSVIPRQRRTAIAAGDAVIEMVEHVMAALSGLGIDNCRVEMNAAETPGLDGSSRGYVDALIEAGPVAQDHPAKIFVVRRPFTASFGGMMISIVPSPTTDFQLTYTLDYSGVPSIGTQIQNFRLKPNSFAEELAPARTFVLEQEIKALHDAGIGRHCTSQDILVFGPEGPIDNPLHFADEPVRHKMLDVIGDLSLLGRQIYGHVVAYKSGHNLNAELVKLLMNDSEFNTGVSESG